MRRVCAGAREHGVAVGAQVSYRDLAGFGRRPISMPADELTNDIVYQIGGLDACARAEGTGRQLRQAARRVEQRLRARPRPGAKHRRRRARGDAALPLLVLPGTELEAQARRAGLTTVPEAFPDRAYEPDGMLRSRRSPGAVLHDVDEITRRAVDLALPTRRDRPRRQRPDARRRVAVPARRQRRGGRGRPLDRGRAAGRRRRVGVFVGST